MLYRLNFYFREWRQKVAEAIYKKISENERSHNVDKLEGVMKMCRKTVKDLRVILSELEEFKAKLLPVDQNKRKNFASTF